jgi:hypothetical protein
MHLFIHEIKVGGESEFATKFNRVSDLFSKAFDETLPEEERDEYWKEYCREKLALELGM